MAFKVPDTIEDVKVEHIREHGGEVIKTEIGKRLIRAEMEAKKNGGFFMNQFANSDRAEEFHESIFITNRNNIINNTLTKKVLFNNFLWFFHFVQISIG